MRIFLEYLWLTKAEVMDVPPELTAMSDCHRGGLVTILRRSGEIPQLFAQDDQDEFALRLDSDKRKEQESPPANHRFDPPLRVAHHAAYSRRTPKNQL